MKSLFSLDTSFEIFYLLSLCFSTFLLKNLYFLLIFVLSFEISTFSLLFFGHLYFLFTFLLKFVRSLQFSFEICTAFTFLLKSLLSLDFSNETSYFLFSFLLKSLLIFTKLYFLTFL